MEKKIDFNSELFRSIKNQKDSGEEGKVDLLSIAKKLSERRAEKLKKTKK